MPLDTQRSEAGSLRRAEALMNVQRAVLGFGFALALLLVKQNQPADLLAVRPGTLL